MAIKNPTPEEVENAAAEGSIPAEIIKPTVQKRTIKVESGTDCEMKSVESPFEPAAEPFKLPTGRLIYSGSGINSLGEIYIRRITTREENLMQTALYRDNGEGMSVNNFLKALNGTINGCIRSTVDISELAIADKLPLLIKLISISYGNKLDAEIECETCQQTTKLIVDLDKDIIISSVPHEMKIPKTIILEDSFPFPVEVDVSMPLVAHEDAFAGDSADLINQLRALIIDARGTKPDGELITKRDIRAIAENIGKNDKAKIKEFVDSCESIGTNLKLKPRIICKNKECPECGTKVSAELPLKYLLAQLAQ